MSFLNRSISKAHSLIMVLAIALIFEGFLIVVPDAFAQESENGDCECPSAGAFCLSPGLCYGGAICGATQDCVCINPGECTFLP